MKIASLVGARPQFIKAAALSRALQQAEMTEVLIHSGQHYDHNLSALFFEEMHIPKPHHQLQCGGLSQGAMTGRMVEKLEEIFLLEKPDCLCVFGDTNTTLAGALAAVKLQIPIAHIEAGLRSHNRRMPEEINRLLTDQCSDFLFTPTLQATQNLLCEGYPAAKIHQVGDIMYDAHLYYQQFAKSHRKLPKDYVLATLHRVENCDDPKRLRAWMEGFCRIGLTTQVIFPLHPRTKNKLCELGLYERISALLTVIEPVGYFEMLHLEANACAILTDSGGMQKEAYFSAVPCLTLRNETEWVELVESGYNTLVPADPDALLFAFMKVKGQKYPPKRALYGDGQAALKVVSKIKKLHSHPFQSRIEDPEWMTQFPMDAQFITCRE